MARIKKGDLVVVRSGADKGKRGRVIRVLPDADKALVEGIRLVYKHLRKSPKHPQGGRIRREAAIWLSKLMPVDPSSDAATRVSYKTVDGQKVRVGRKSGASIDAQTKARGGKSAGRGSEA
jgi:large subunit ribosomal protein L24